ncbi:MAG TPA: APC family permease [Actinomycetota bacterium]|nr:APC family permease [Actinomycetota bacterium]
MTITLAVIGPAASVFAIGSVALRQQGSGAFLAFLLAALISGCLAVAWAELGVLYPTAGGVYGIVARVLGRRAGFLALTLQLALFVIVPSAFALAAGQSVAALWPAISPRTGALVLLAAATALAVVGIRFNAAVTATFLALELAIILVVSVLGFANADWSLAGTLLDPRVYAADGSAVPTSLRTLLAGVVLGLGAYAGYGGAVIFSEETRGPRRGIARAVLGALGVAVVAELLALAAALVGAPSQAQLTTEPAPMSYLVRSLGGDRLVTIVTLALVATFFNILLAVLLEYARILYSSGRDRTWPAPLSRALGRIHPRTRTPVVASLSVGGAALAVTAVTDYAAAVTFASLTVVVTFALIALSALASRLRQPGLDRPYRMPLWPLPPLVALAGVAVTVVLQTGRDLAIVAAILAAGALYEAAYLRRRRDTHWILLDPLVDEPVSATER